MNEKSLLSAEEAAVLSSTGVKDTAAVLLRLASSAVVDAAHDGYCYTSISVADKSAAAVIAVRDTLMRLGYKVLSTGSSMHISW